MVVIVCVVVLAGAVGNPDQDLSDPFWVGFVLLLVVGTAVRARLDARRGRQCWLDLVRLERASPEQLDAAEHVVRADAAPGTTGEAVLALRVACTAERTHGRLAGTWVLALGLAAAVVLQPLFQGWWAPSWVAAGVSVVVALVVQRRWRHELRRRQAQLGLLIARPSGLSPH